uniref:Uncharacterized protein n=1 Tax=Romanomermis culicivorax TaxID=13658 RepID=A0A915HWS5_ROMCU
MADGRKMQQLADASVHHYLQALNDKSVNADGNLTNQSLDQASQTILNENKKLQSKLASICEEYEARLDQIRQDYQRKSAEKEETLLFEFEELKSKYGNLSSNSDIGRCNDRSFIDSSTLTDPDLSFTNLLALQNQDLDDCRQQSVLLQKKLTELEFLVHAYETEFGTLPVQVIARTDKTHSSFSECSNQICLTKLAAAKAQIEAYEKECYIWRTKASELEISSKQLMASHQNLQSQFEEAKTSQAASRDGAKTLRKSSRPSDTSYSSIRSGDKVSCIEHIEMITRLENETSELRKTLGIIDKERVSLTDENHDLYDEYNNLRDDNEENIRRIKILEGEMNEMRAGLAETEDALRSSENALNDCDRQLLSKRTELEVAQLNCQKLRIETEKMNSDKANLEEKIRFLENVMVEAGVTIGNPAAARRKTSRMQNQQQVVYRAREVQTELGYLEEMKIENELKEVNQRYENLRECHGAQIMDLENRITEMATNLQLKTNLVTTLTNQLQLLQDEISSLHSGMERERALYNQKMHELNLVASRVPFLENDITAARDEMRAMEQEYAKEKDRFEKALASTASDVLKSQQDTSQFYRAVNLLKLREKLKFSSLIEV